MIPNNFPVFLAMIVVGLCGLTYPRSHRIEDKRARRLHYFCIAWAAFWWLPPLASLWIKGVMG